MDSSKQEQYQSICQDLDQAFIEYFELLEMLVNNKQKLEQNMKNGYFQLAKARINTSRSASGITPISSTQYPSNMEATVKVELKEEESLYQFSLSEIDNNSSKSNEETEVQGSDLKSNKSGVMRTSPLTWFGALPSPALRQCQKEFKKSMESVVDVVNVMFQLEHISRRVEELQNKKAQICMSEVEK